MAETAVAAALVAGGYALFKGYAELDAGQEAILDKDQAVKILRIEGEPGEEEYVVVAVDDDGNEILDPETGQPAKSERCFDVELEPAVFEPETPAVEETPAPAKRTRGKAAAAPAAETTPAPASTETAEKPKGRGRKAAEPKAETPAKTTTKATTKPAAPSTKAKGITPTPVVQLADLASVTEVLKSGDALKAAKDLVDRAEQTDFTLGGVLRHIHETGVFKSLGFDGKRGFDDYVEKTLGLQPRKARYLMATYTAVALAGVDEAKLAEIGWSKAKEIARLSTEDLRKNFDKLVEFAKDNTRDDLIAHIQKKFKVVTRGGEQKVALTGFSFKFAEEDANTVQEALKSACDMIGEQDLNKALLYIVGEWRGHSAGSDLDLDQTIELMNAKFGGTFTFEADAAVEGSVSEEEQVAA